jgi:hypothetical protein
VLLNMLVVVTAMVAVIVLIKEVRNAVRRRRQ